MSQATGNIQKDFLCPHCHEDMSNAEMLQVHLQTVHQAQSSTTSKGTEIDTIFCFRWILTKSTNFRFILIGQTENQRCFQ